MYNVGILMRNRLSRGFTLIEIAVTLLMAAIFAAIAIPSYYSLIQNNKVSSVANRLSASFSFARMEAVRRGVRVSVCSAANASFTACGTSAQWPQGWIIFTDADNDNAINQSGDLVKIAESLPGGILVTANTNIVSYDGAGFLTSPALTMSLSATGCKGNNARTLSIASGGRLSIATVACN